MKGQQGQQNWSKNWHCLRYILFFFFFNLKGEKFIVIIVFSGGMCIFKSGVARHGNTCSAWSEKGF